MLALRMARGKKAGPISPRNGSLLINYTISKPTSPSYLDPALPTQTTLQRSQIGGNSSRTSSTIWPRLRWKLPRIRKPPCEKSRTRQECLLWLTTRLARLFDSTRIDWRPWGIGRLSILSPRYFRLRFLQLAKSECLHPMFDRRIKADAYDVIVAGELLAIDNRALHPESRRR